MQENNGRRNPFLLAPSIVLVLLAFFGVLSFIPLGNGFVPYIIAIVSELIIFGGAIAASVYLRGTGWTKRCLAHGPKGSFLLCISAAGMMMVQSVGIRSFVIENFYDYRIFELYGMRFESATDSFGSFLWVFAALAVIPAVLEGVFFRGFLMHEYRYGGVFLSILVSSFLYAMTGMSIANFPIHFINGVLLSSVVFLTGSVVYSVLAHVAYALFALSVEKYIFFIAEETRTLIFLVLVAVGLLSAIGFCGSAERLLRQRGEDEERAPIRLKKGRFLVVLKDMLTAPMLWADVGCFVLVCLLHILLDA